jgi:amino acid adenylation domain-containing protein
LSVAAFDIETVLPLTPLQHGMLFHSLLDPASANYFQQLVAVLDGDLDGAAFEAAWADLVNRHAALRAAFLWERQDSPRQAIFRRVRIPTVWLDWRDVAEGERDALLNRFLAEDRAVPFTLAQAPLMRLAVIRTAADSHILVFSHHHLILDGWSTAVMMEEVLALYAGNVQGTAAALPVAPRYTDYLTWLASRDEAATRQFWQETLLDFTEPTPLVADRRSGAAEAAAFKAFTHILPPATQRRLEDFARANRVSSAVPAMAACALALGRQAERDEVVFGVTVAGRPAELPGMERLVGLCINTIPLRVPAPRTGTLGPWLRGIQDRLAAAQPFEHAGLTEIQGWSGMPAGVPLFETILVYENYPAGAPPSDAPLTLASARIEERANYPLALVVEPQPDGLHLSLTADVNRIPADAAQRLLSQVAYLLESLAAGTDDTGIEALDLLTADERQRIVHDWNDTAADYERTATLHGLFVRQAARTPDAVALIDAAGTVTYGELERLSRRLAGRIQAADLPADRPVAVRMARDRFLVAGLLAILRSGRAYVPLVRSLPGERVATILETLSIPCVLTQAAFVDETVALLGDPTVKVLAADRPEAAPAAPVPDRSSAEDLAYVIFTSGSTGRPKGVMVRHRPAINLIEWINRNFAVGPSDRLLFVTSPAFDLSVYDLFGILAAGGSIRIASDDEVEDPERLAAILAHEPITFWDSAPAALWQLAPLLPERVEHSTLRLIFLGGDWVPLPLPDRMRAVFPGVSVVALGGATEATIWSNYHVVDRVEPDWRSIPYGRPIQNARYYILGPDLRPVPHWVPGDLFIGGECLSDGYAGEPELTAAKFIADPFVPIPDARMYRTGDRARFFPDGTMEFLGRIDGQVKIRGFRIELGEVESALARCPAVKDAVAVLHVTGSGGPAGGSEEREIVGYVVPQDGQAVDLSAVTAHLRTLLPAPMVPAYIVKLEGLPLTANGKIDRKALPAPVKQQPVTGTTTDGDMVADIVARVWAGVLGLDNVPRDADFFTLGGHSLRATSVIAQLRIAFGLDIPLALLFRHPTVRGLSAAIAALQTGGDTFATEIVPLDRSAPLPLSQAQERLWFLQRLETARSTPLCWQPGCPAGWIWTSSHRRWHRWRRGTNPFVAASPSRAGDRCRS